MATYEYRCDDCGAVFSRHERVSEHAAAPPPRCPKCEGEHVHQVLSPFFAQTAKKS